MTAGKKTQDEAPQARRFIETARELGCDESEEAFDAKFRKLVPAKHEGDMAKPRKGQKRSLRRQG